jgi:hypothetical protein
MVHFKPEGFLPLGKAFEEVERSQLSGEGWGRPLIHPKHHDLNGSSPPGTRLAPIGQFTLTHSGTGG